MEHKFIMSDLLLFHKFIYELIPVSVPEEIIPLSVRTRSHANISHKYQVKCDVQVTKKRNVQFVLYPCHTSLLDKPPLRHKMGKNNA